MYVEVWVLVAHHRSEGCTLSKHLEGSLFNAQFASIELWISFIVKKNSHAGSMWTEWTCSKEISNTATLLFFLFVISVDQF